LVKTLDEKELKLAAESSYFYWLATLSDQLPTDAETEKMALREARRFIHGNSYEDACRLAKEACVHRVTRRIDLVRACFMEGVEYDSDEDKDEAEKIRCMIVSIMFQKMKCLFIILCPFSHSLFSTGC
jgi:hypothetical protein